MTIWAFMMLWYNARELGLDLTDLQLTTLKDHTLVDGVLYRPYTPNLSLYYVCMAQVWCRDWCHLSARNFTTHTVTQKLH